MISNQLCVVTRRDTHSSRAGPRGGGLLQAGGGGRGPGGAEADQHGHGPGHHHGPERQRPRGGPASPECHHCQGEAAHW